MRLGVRAAAPSPKVIAALTRVAVALIITRLAVAVLASIVGDVAGIASDRAKVATADGVANAVENLVYYAGGTGTWGAAASAVAAGLPLLARGGAIALPTLR